MVVYTSKVDVVGVAVAPFDRFSIMKRVLLVVLAALATGAFAQEYGRPVRFVIRHADPWAVKAMLEGQALLSPELSTILGFMGAPPQTQNAANGLFKNGKFVVNAADNTLYWFPEKR